MNFSLRASQKMLIWSHFTFLTSGISTYNLSSPADLNRSHAGWVHYSYYNKNLTVVKQLSSLGIYLHLNTLKYTLFWQELKFSKFLPQCTLSECKIDGGPGGRVDRNPRFYLVNSILKTTGSGPGWAEILKVNIFGMT